jgi:UDP-2,3-diacylglucosamine hydrolase
VSRTLFISDLHLSAERNDIAQCFFDFMENEALHCDALYILGDLFEVWIGDDNNTPFTDKVASVIARVAQTSPVYFIHGNRDFAIREAYAKKCNMQLLPEQCVIDLYGLKTLISHGDELCTKDVEYMKFRKKARGWWWPRLMLAIPLPIRQKMAAKGREKSKQNQH